MSFKDILCPILSVDTDEPALAAAEIVAQLGDARLTALLVDIELDFVYEVGIGTMREASVDMLAARQERVDAEQRKLETRAARGPRRFEVRNLSVTSAHLGNDLGAQARNADLTVMLRPGETLFEDFRRAMVEGALFDSGRPVLVVPPDWRPGPIGRNIVVGWNGKREAARALADAGPFLDAAEKVTVLCVAQGAERSQLEASGEAVVSHLVRRGKRAKLRWAGEFGFSDGATLMGQAGGLEADLIVMGGYGRARMREFVFGGVTREVMKSARLPVLMSH